MEEWSGFAIEYYPVKAGSIDGTDTEPHDRAVVRAINAVHTVNKQDGVPENTIFIARLDKDTTSETIKKIFSQFGNIKKCSLVRDIVTGFSKGYAFVEYDHESGASKAYRKANKMTIDGKSIFVDFECGRLLQGWKPRRLGKLRSSNTSETEASEEDLINEVEVVDDYKHMLRAWQRSGGGKEKEPEEHLKSLMKFLENEVEGEERIKLAVKTPPKGTITTNPDKSKVLVGSDGSKRLEWPMGIIVELFPESDSITRLARVVTNKGVILRPIQRLYPLEVPDDRCGTLRTSFEEKRLASSEDPSRKEVQPPKTTRSSRRVNVPSRYTD
uniref:U11/U12 small nuclear ribonucleoprotein 35 kDa protein n=1 Tax=Timema genevievae TaxID=629358 RepID=A0A7R9K725_TIMGE|nr:unnamed protein product [Timema genevievae]